MGQRQAGVVGNVLAQRLPAVERKAADRLVAAVLRDQHAGALGEARTVLRRPPVAQQALGVAMAALVVEFDAHKLDSRLKVILARDPLGGKHSVEIERVWLLAVINVATRCVLAGRWTWAVNAMASM